MLVSSLFPRFRDTAIIWTVIATMLFYGTPVLYPLEVVPQALGDILMLNPLAPLFEAARVWVIDPTAPDPVAAAGGWLPLLAPIAIYLAICGAAVWVFNREAPRIAEDL
jgi:ABC-2 type transport system permease protein